MEKHTFLDRLEAFNEQLNLTHYWIIFLKFKRIIFFLPIFIGLLGYLIALNIRPVFQSNATLVIEKGDKNIISIEEVYVAEGSGGFGSSYNHINNQIQILKSDEVIGGIFLNEKITKEIGKLHKTLPEKFSVKNINALKKLIFFKSTDDEIEEKNLSGKEDLKNYIPSNFTINHIRNSDVVELSVTSHNPKLAKFLLEQIIDAYLKYDVNTKVAVTAYANQQINLRMSELLNQLEKAPLRILINL